MSKELKIFALEYVKLHDHLLKEQKLAIGQFIMEASDDQVKYMLITGEVKDNLTEEDIVLTKRLIQEKSPFAAGWESGVEHGEKYGGYKGYNRGVQNALTAVAIVAAVVTASYAIYKRFLSKAAKACKEKGGLEKTNCMVKYKKQAQAARIKELQAGMSRCEKSKDPSTCKLKLQKRINKEKAKMGAM